MYRKLWKSKKMFKIDMILSALVLILFVGHTVYQEKYNKF